MGKNCGGTYGLAPLEFIQRLDKFSKMVGSGCKYDIKNRPDWNETWYYFDGYILRFDDPGNIVYGVMVKETFADVEGLEEFIGHSGAGTAQILDNIMNPLSAAFDDLEKETKEAKWHQRPKKISGTGYYSEFYSNLRDFQRFLERVEYVDEHLDTSNVNWEVLSYWPTGFDDPRDYEAVDLGYDYYDKLFGN